MPHRTMLTTVLLASTLWIIAYTITHYSIENAFDSIETYKDAYKANKTEAFLHDLYDTMEAVPANISWTNTTVKPEPADSDEQDEAYLTSELPKVTVLILITSVLRYYWLIWLERILPGRPRPFSGPAVRAEKEDDDSREEEVIRKWIEAGKVRRASLSWCNTFGKLLLDLTIGGLWYNLIWMVAMPMLALKYPWKDFDKWELLFKTGTGFFGVTPVATLIGFILVPAHKRIVFEAGVDLAWKVFFGAFLHVLVPWAMRQQFVQEILRNNTDYEMGDSPVVTWHRGANESGVDEL